MTKYLLTLFFSFFGITILYAQQYVRGKVTDLKNNALPGANITIKGTYEGTTTDSSGNYQLKLSNSQHSLIASFVGYEALEKTIPISQRVIIIDFKLQEKTNELSGVVITAGTYETSDRKRSVTMKPLDIVTTPSSNGDLTGALTTLPGTSAIGEDGRLFVRGGDGYECKTFIDGTLSKKPYNANVPDLPSRGRFSPMLFKGTTFSTGGYSAEYGQALSSALILTTNSFPTETATQISLLTVGMGIAQTIKGENTALYANVDYSNLKPYFKLVNGYRFNMTHYPESLGITLNGYQKMGKNGLLKVLSSFSGSIFGLKYPDLSQHPDSLINICIKNRNSYTNVSYTDEFPNGWFLKTGISFTYDHSNMDLEHFTVKEDINNLQAKVTFKKNLTKLTSLLIGAEETYNNFSQIYIHVETAFRNQTAFADYLTALYAETDFKPMKYIALRLGVRSEYSSLMHKINAAPRISAAWLLNKDSQISLAYGEFYQTPEENLLRFTHNLSFEHAQHLIANYQWESNNRILRIEAYRKNYKNMVCYNSNEFWNASFYNNEGYGHSQGVDIFFRDQQSIKNVEYWISYSYLNSKRLYRDYPKLVTPSFAPEHSLSMVGKWWINKIHTLLGVSSTFATGRPYNNPNSQNFMDARAPFYHDISINGSYIFRKSSVVYVAINNVLGRDNIYGYRYYAMPDEKGIYEALPLKSPNKRFFLIGVFFKF